MGQRPESKGAMIGTVVSVRSWGYVAVAERETASSDPADHADARPEEGLGGSWRTGTFQRVEGLGSERSRAPGERGGRTPLQTVLGEFPRGVVNRRSADGLSGRRHLRAADCLARRTATAAWRRRSEAPGPVSGRLGRPPRTAQGQVPARGKGLGAPGRSRQTT